MSDALTAHYAEVIRFIESLITRRFPRVPFTSAPAALTDAEVTIVARGLAHAHQVAQTEVAR